jgi:aminoglycoside 2'-N-acetyltransferase I
LRAQLPSVGDNLGRMRVRSMPTKHLTPAEVAAIRELMVVAFRTDDDEGFTDHDWEHAVGGTHFVLDLDGEIVTHASVVERELRIAGHPLRTGYVEAVATSPERQGAGYGTRVMTDVTAFIKERFELGALGTGRHGFYERMGWVTWRGESFVRTADGTHRTPDEDGYILILPTPSSPALDVTASISCAWRPGDVW